MGLHLEGPWINPLKRGAHLEAFIHKPTKKEVIELLETAPFQQAELRFLPRDPTDK